MRRRPACVALVLAVPVLAVASLAACGRGEPTPTAGSAGCRRVTVSIGDFTFQPSTVKVHRCDSVVWENAHDQAHTSTGSGTTSWNTGTIEPGKRAKAVRFDEAGTFAYVCALHPFMHGEVDVS